MKQDKRIITKNFLRKHGFEYLERFGFWYKRVPFLNSYSGMAFRYRYDRKELETQRYNIIGGREPKYYNEEDGCKLIKEYVKCGLIDKGITYLMSQK